MKWLKKLFRPVCPHKWEKDGALRPTGYATLSWLARAVPQWEEPQRCTLCGATRIDGGYYLPRSLTPEYFKVDPSWPHDPKTGEKLPIPPYGGASA